MTNTDGIWTPAEAEEAFVEFGNAFLQFVKMQREFGLVENAPPEATEQLMRYFGALSSEKLVRLTEFTASVPSIAEAIAGLIEVEILRRTVIALGGTCESV